MTTAGPSATLAPADEPTGTIGGRRDRADLKRLDTGMAWGEDPPSRTRHIISNVEVEPGDTASELKVYSNFLVYRTRAETEQDLYVGARHDILRRVDGGWKIARRKLLLDQNVLLPKNVSVFF